MALHRVWGRNPGRFSSQDLPALRRPQGQDRTSGIEGRARALPLAESLEPRSWPYFFSTIRPSIAGLTGVWARR